MTLLLKDPAAALDYAVDWGAEYLAGETLAQSSWQVTPQEVGGLALKASSTDGKTATATVEGGVAGHVYQLTNHVTLSTGLADNRSIVLRVETR
jgi:hypothetical protein